MSRDTFSNIVLNLGVILATLALVSFLRPRFGGPLSPVQVLFLYAGAALGLSGVFWGLVLLLRRIRRKVIERAVKDAAERGGRTAPR